MIAETSISIRLEAYSWISSSLGMPERGRQVINKKLKTGAVLTDLLKELAGSYPEFRREVYDPERGWISDQVMVIVNHKLIQAGEFAQTWLKDHDEVNLSPVLAGG